MWLAYILYCRDIELACDEKVIKGYTVEQVKCYSKALVSCGEGHSRILVCPIAFGEVGIKARVRNILNYKKPGLWIMIGAAVVCVIVAVCFMTVRGEPKEDTDGTETTEQTEDTETTDGTESTDTDPTDEPTEPHEPTDESIEPSKDLTDEPTEEPSDSTEPTKPTEPTAPAVTSPEPTQKDISIVGIQMRPTGAKDIPFEVKDIFSEFGDYREYFESVTVNVANSVDSQQSYQIQVFTDWEEFGALAEAVNAEANTSNDFTAYGEDFFGENILILATGKKPDRLSASGGELCLEFDHDINIGSYGVLEMSPAIVTPPSYWGVIVSRKNVGEIDVVSICSKHLYKNMPYQVPAKPREFTVKASVVPIDREEPKCVISKGHRFNTWNYKYEQNTCSVPVNGSDKSIYVHPQIYESDFWLKWYLSSGWDHSTKENTVPQVFDKYDAEFFSKKALIMLDLKGTGSDHELYFDGKRDGKLYFTVKVWEGILNYKYDSYSNSWSFVEIDRSLMEGVNGIVIYAEVSGKQFSVYAGNDKTGECAENGHTYIPATCEDPDICKRCGATRGLKRGHSFPEYTGACSRCGADGPIFKGPDYKYVAKSSSLSGQSVKLTEVLKIDTWGTYTGFAYPSFIETKVAKVNEKYVDSINRNCEVGFDFIYSYAGLRAALDAYRVDSKMDALDAIVKSDFDDKVLVAVYRSFPANNLHYEIEKTVKKGEELHFVIKTDMDRNDRPGEPIVAGSLRIYWVDRDDLEGIETVSLYVEDMHPNYPTLSPYDGHIYGESNGICKVCGVKQGESHVHTYTDVTCTKVATCMVCGVTKGEPLGHKYTDATCTKPATCTRCGVTKGDPLWHWPTMATCTDDGTCAKCGASVEKATGHEFVNNVCIRMSCGCGREKTDPSVKYIYPYSKEDLVIDILDGAISFDGGYEITNGWIKITCKMKNCDDLIRWNMSQVKSYVNGKLTDMGNMVTAGVKKAGDEWDEMTFYIPYTEDGEYLINLHYGDPTMPYTVTVSFPVVTKYSNKF